MKSLLQLTLIANLNKIRFAKSAHFVENPLPATNNFYRAWRSPKKVLMQKSQKFCADFKYVNLKIELLQIFEKKSFSSLFLMRKPLSSDQKWFLRPYFPLIGGIFVLKSGLRFLFRALEVSIQKVRKSHFLSRRKPKLHGFSQIAPMSPDHQP